MASLAILGVPTVAVLLFTWFDHATPPQAPAPVEAVAAKVDVKPAGAAPAPVSAAVRPGRRDVTVALSQWPGHMALVVGNGGLTTQPGSAAAAEGLDLKIVFIEDAPSKNKALRRREGRRRLADRRRAADRARRLQGGQASTCAPSCRSTGRAAATPASPRKEVQKVEDVSAARRRC